MDQITTEINKLNLKIDAIEQLLKKPFKAWTEGEKEEFGNHEQLRKKEEQLRKKEEQLRKKEEPQRTSDFRKATTARYCFPNNIRCYTSKIR